MISRSLTVLTSNGENMEAVISLKTIVDGVNPTGFADESFFYGCKLRSRPY
jgi:hypothetical protein